MHDKVGAGLSCLGCVLWQAASRMQLGALPRQSDSSAHVVSIHAGPDGQPVCMHRAHRASTHRATLICSKQQVIATWPSQSQQPASHTSAGSVSVGAARGGVTLHTDTNSLQGPQGMGLGRPPGCSRIRHAASVQVKSPAHKNCSQTASCTVSSSNATGSHMTHHGPDGCDPSIMRVTLTAGACC